LHIQEQLGNLSGKATSLHQLGNLAYLQGDYEQARSLYQQSLQIQEQLGNLSGKATSLGQLGLLAEQEGETEQALVFIIQAFLLFQTLRSPMQQQALRVLHRLVQQLGEATFLRCWQSLAGNLPIPDFTSTQTAPSFVNLLIEFIQMSTWEESRQFLHTHPELLTSDADEALASLLEQQEREDVRATIEEHRHLLRRCREVGIDPAFEERASSSPALQTNDDESEGEQATLEKVPQVVASILVHGSHEQRQQLVSALTTTEQELPVEQEELRTFLHCLVAVLSGEIPDVSSLQSPFLELEAIWQAEEHKQEQEGSHE
jgi:tetratricopeptide (TPR) repeat protein